MFHLLFIVALYLSFPVSDAKIFSTYSSINKVSYVTTVTKSKINKSPKWKDHNENPPLSVRRAVLIAHEHLPAAAGNPKSWGVESVCLQYLSNIERWIYVIEFIRMMDPKDGPSRIDTLRLILLFDGTVLELQQAKKK